MRRLYQGSAARDIPITDDGRGKALSGSWERMTQQDVIEMRAIRF